MRTAYRQGDVLLFKVEKRPELRHQITDGVLAYGEATGHSHKVVGDFELYWAELDGEGIFDEHMPHYAKMLNVKTSASLTHEEHKTIELPPGDYIVMTEAEYVPDGWQNVGD